jgi:hypothetical protein
MYLTNTILLDFSPCGPIFVYALCFNITTSGHLLHESYVDHDTAGLHEMTKKEPLSGSASERISAPLNNWFIFLYRLHSFYRQ